MLKLWEIDDGEQWWYSAETRERAIELHMEPLKKADGTYDLPCELDELEVTEYSSDTKLKVRQDDDSYVEQTAAEWAAGGEGPVACTVW